MDPHAMETATAVPDFDVEDFMVVTGGTGGPTLSFTVKGEPLAQARHKIAWKGLRNHIWKDRNSPIIYDPSAKFKKKYAAQVREAMVAMALTPPFFASGYNDDGLVMELHFFLERPKSHYNVLGNRLKAAAPKYPKGKDVDNMEKFVSDALHGVVYNNDNIIRKSQTEKAFSKGAGFTKVVFRNYI